MNYDKLQYVFIDSSIFVGVSWVSSAWNYKV